MSSDLAGKDTSDDKLIFELGKAIWCWNSCNKCDEVDASNVAICNDESCTKFRAPPLYRYLQYYKVLTTMYLNSDVRNVICTRRDLFSVLELIRKSPSATLAELAQNAFPGTNVRGHERSNAIKLGLKILTMIDSSALQQSSDRLEGGNFRISWEDHVKLNDYLDGILPTSIHPTLSQVNNTNFADMKDQLKAVNLKKSLGIKLIPTSDIQNHLRFDRKHNILEVFHYTSFLKEELRATKERSIDQNTSSITILPRQLVLEVLDTLQTVLFPIAHRKSRDLLQSLVVSSDFDPDILRYEVSSIRREGEESVSYIYFAKHLSELYSELQSPSPRGRLQRIVQRKSGARYIMMATIIGVVFAVFLGIASLVVGSYQTYIAYQAWKHPVDPSLGG